MKSNPAVLPIRAAGGLLWRYSGSSLRLAIVHRSRYGDWALPKGKLKTHESWLKAALREVEEETGYTPSILSFAGAVAYDTTQGPKVVRYWNMTPANAEPPGELDPDEIDSVAWVAPARAIRQLSYPLEQVLVEAWHGQIAF